MKSSKTIHYFDNAATTPVRLEVFDVMKPYFSEYFGNPSNLDSLGRKSKEAVNNALKKISSVLNCRPNEFVFTGSATEADNLAIIGTARANKINGNKIIVSNVEHKGIYSACKKLEKDGFKIIKVGVRQNGLISPNDLSKLIDHKTILVSITSADNETGTIQPIKELVRTVKNKATLGKHIYFHTDAAQVASYLDLDVQKLGIDLLTLSGHKIYGPKGIGGLYIRRGTPIEPIIYGGGQQGGVRSGTENVPGIIGFAHALMLAGKDRIRESEKIKHLRDDLAKGIFSSIDKVLLNGHPEKRLPNFLNISILDIEGEAALLRLDNYGIIANTGSACNSQSLEPSHIIIALGRPYELAHGSLRFTLGKYTKKTDIIYVMKYLPKIVADLRKLSPLNLKLLGKNKMSDLKPFVGNQIPHFLKKQQE